MNRDLSELLPQVRDRADRFLSMAQQAGHELIITEAYRSPERQAELYVQGRTTPGDIVTRAHPGWSWHQWRRAFDFAWSGPNPYDPHHPWAAMGEIGQYLGLIWGGSWSNPDKPHLELIGRLSLGLRCEILDGEMIPGASNPAVSELQVRLRMAGFPPGRIDGIYGNRTKGAVLLLQQAVGLELTGVFGLDAIEPLEDRIDAAVKGAPTT